MKQLRGLYAQTFFTFRTILYFSLFLTLLPIHCSCRYLSLLLITLRDPCTLGSAPLDEGSARPLPDNTQHSQKTNIPFPGGIRTHNRRKRAAADRRPIRFDHRYRLIVAWLTKIIRPVLQTEISQWHKSLHCLDQFGLCLTCRVLHSELWNDLTD